MLGDPYGYPVFKQGVSFCIIASYCRQLSADIDKKNYMFITSFVSPEEGDIGLYIILVLKVFKKNI